MTRKRTIAAALLVGAAATWWAASKGERPRSDPAAQTRETRSSRRPDRSVNELRDLLHPDAHALGRALPPAPAVRARTEGEWKGMPIDDEQSWPCFHEDDAVPRCSMARACVDGRCVGCREDGDCLAGEMCVLDHCIRDENVGCLSRHDCAEGAEATCVLSGITSLDPRGNADMRSYCSATNGPSPHGQEDDADSSDTQRVDLGQPQYPDPVRSTIEQLRRQLDSNGSG